jgi:hypothetical protein
MWSYLRSLRRHRDSTRPIPYVDPLRAGRHPFQIYMLSLCVAAGIPYFFGQASAEAVQNQLPEYLALGWGISLTVGASIGLLGSFWRGGYDMALTLERIGLYLTGIAAIIYALCILGARSVFAPELALGIALGAWLMVVPLPDSWNPRVSDTLTAAGLAVALAGGIALPFTDALPALAGSLIIAGFGLSCLQRTRDISRIFNRAGADVRVIVDTEEGR